MLDQMRNADYLAVVLAIFSRSSISSVVEPVT